MDMAAGRAVDPLALVSVVAVLLTASSGPAAGQTPVPARPPGALAIYNLLD